MDWRLSNWVNMGTGVWQMAETGKKKEKKEAGEGAQEAPQEGSEGSKPPDGGSA